MSIFCLALHKTWDLLDFVLIFVTVSLFVDSESYPRMSK